MITDIFDEPLVLETERLRLRPVTMNDADDLYEIFADELVMKYYDRLPLKTREEADDLAKMFIDCMEKRTMLRWGIEEKSTGRLIGTCGFFCFSDINQKAEVGYDLRRDRWGMGLMTEALDRIIRFFYEKTNVNRIEAFVEVPNLGSMGVLKKLGFVNEGTLRQYEMCRSELIDITIWSVIRSDMHR